MPKKPPVGVSQPGELVIRVHLPIKCTQVEHHTPDKFVQRSVIFLNKNPPVGVSQPGELVIRVHLPIKCTQVEHHTPDKFVQRLVIFLNKNPQMVLFY